MLRLPRRQQGIMNFALVRGGSLRMDDETRDTILRFHDALNSRDLDALDELITDDCVFDATSPAPDGTRHVGRQAVLEACRAFFAGSPATHFEMEEMFGAGDRVIVRWLYTWTDGHVRGVDVLRVRAGRVAETLAYVKG
jgi:ketosteroid isomerase-like protein